METNELVRKAKSGDSEAFGQLYDQFAQRIFRYIRLKIQAREEAEDILQEVFTKAYKGLNSLSLEDLNFSAWLYRVTGNTINDHFRKRYRTPEITIIDENFDIASDLSVEKEAAINFDVETAKKAMAELPPLYKQVLELRFIQGFSPEEVGKIIKKSNLSVRLLQFRALKKVQIILKNNHVSKR